MPREERRPMRTRVRSQLVGERIKEARRGKGWSRRELGRRVGRVLSAVGRWERGEGLSVEMLLKVSRVLEVEASWLVGKKVEGL